MERTQNCYETSSYLGGLGKWLTSLPQWWTRSVVLDQDWQCPYRGPQEYWGGTFQIVAVYGGSNDWGPWILKSWNATWSREELVHSRCQCRPYWRPLNPMVVSEVLSALFLSSSQAEHWKRLEWCPIITLSICIPRVCTCMLNHFSCVRLFATPWTVALQAPLSVVFSRQEYWNGLPFPSPRGLPNPGIESVSPMSPVLQADSLPLSHQGSPCISHLVSNAVLLGVRTDPVVLGQDAQNMAAWIQSFVAGAFPALSSTETVQMQVGIWPGCCGWLWIVFHALLSLKGRRPFIVATGLASRAWAAVSAHCPASGHYPLCWEGGYRGDRWGPTGAQVHLPVVTGQAGGPDDAEQDSGWSKDS